MSFKSDKNPKELLDAIGKGDLVQVIKLLKSFKGIVNSETEKNERALGKALKLKQKVIAFILLEEKEIQVNFTLEDSGTPLHLAAREGYGDLLFKMLSLMQERGEPMEWTRDNHGSTPLHVASDFGHLSCLNALLQYNPDLELTSFQDYTALHMAAKNGHLNIVQKLLDQGANPDPVAQKGYTPLHLACLSGKLPVVQALLSRGARVSKVTTNNESCVHLAARNGHNPILTALQSDLKFSSNLNRGDKNGKTPLHLAIERGKRDTAKLLIDLGANLNCYDQLLNSPLHSACSMGDAETTKLLVETKRINLDSISMNLDTPLLIALKNRHFECVELLIRAGCSVSAIFKVFNVPLSPFGDKESLIQFLHKEINKKDVSEFNTLQGFLECKGQLNFFKIQDGLLLQYESDNIPKPKDSMVLSGCQVSEINQTTFLVHSAHYPEVFKQLTAVNATQQAKWMRALEDGIELSKQRLENIVEKHGWLQKKGKDRWFVLKRIDNKPCLMWFSDHLTPERLVPQNAKNHLPIADCAVKFNESSQQIDIVYQEGKLEYHLKGKIETLKEWTKHLERYTQHYAEGNLITKPNWKTLFLTTTIDEKKTNINSKEEAENKLSIASDPLIRSHLLEKSRGMRLITPDPRFFVGKIRGPSGPFSDIIYGSNSSFLCQGSSISTYPMNLETGLRQGDPICDRYCVVQYENFAILAVADGCGWGAPSRDAALIASDTFVEYMRSHCTEILDDRQAFILMLRALKEAHLSIIGERKMEEIFTVGTTTLIGGMIFEVFENQFLFCFVNLGDCKAYVFREKTRQVEEISIGNRSKDPKDPGGRLGPQLEGGLPDLRNLSLYSTICSEGDIVFICSDGVHDNLDPEQLGITPHSIAPLKFSENEKWSQLNDSKAQDLKLEWSCHCITNLLSKLVSINPSSIVETLIQHCNQTTQPSRVWMETHPNDKLPFDYALYPGKLDHTTCIALRVGHYNASSIESVDEKQQFLFARKSFLKISSLPEPREGVRLGKSRTPSVSNSQIPDNFPLRDSSSGKGPKLLIGERNKN